ncbi:MAG: radical SAM protein [Chloroflexota bacterium]
MQVEPKIIEIKNLQFENVLAGNTVSFHGRSMEPFLQDGDELKIAPVAWEAIRLGDIVTFALEDKFPTLRVVEKRGNKMWLIGDNWPRRKFVAWREHLLGKVIARIRDGKTLTSDTATWRNNNRYRLWRYQAGWVYSRLRQLPQRIEGKLARRRAQRFERPPNIQVNVSSNCNLKCRMCPYLSIHQSPHHLNFMSSDTFEQILPLVKEINAIHLSGSGEPMFHQQLFDFVARVREEAPTASIDMTSNGTLLTEARARKLIQHQVTKLHVSFDGLPERVESIRIGVNGRKVMDNIRRLTRLKKEMGSQYPIVQINYMTGYGTYWDLNKFIELCHEVGVAEIQMLEMQPATAEDVADNLLNGTGLDDGAALKTAVMLANHYAIKLHLPTTTQNACYYPFNPHVGEDGEVYPCCYLDYDGRQLYSNGQEMQLPPITYGNINNNAFDEIWDNPNFIALRERNSQGKFDDICQACYDVRWETAVRVGQILGTG